MKLLILGATGSIGSLLVEQALHLGHTVTAFARHLPQNPITHPQLNYIVGDALDSVALNAAVQGQDAVIYSLGIDKYNQPTTLFSDTTRLLIAAMRKHHVHRLIAITGIGAGNSKGHGGWFYDWVIFPLFTRKAYADKDVQEDLIRRSNLDWTIVRPASFNNGPRRGKLRAADDLEGITISSISRADTAAFVLDQLNTNEWLNRSPLIGY